VGIDKFFSIEAEIRRADSSIKGGNVNLGKDNRASSIADVKTGKSTEGAYVSHGYFLASQGF
jgi:hypothetical protein